MVAYINFPCQREPNHNTLALPSINICNVLSAFRFILTVCDVTGLCGDSCLGKPNGDYQSVNRPRPYYYSCQGNKFSYKTCHPNEVFNPWPSKCGEAIARMLAFVQKHNSMRSIIILKLCFTQLIMTIILIEIIFLGLRKKCCSMHYKITLPKPGYDYYYVDVLFFEHE